MGQSRLCATDSVQTRPIPRHKVHVANRLTDRLSWAVADAEGPAPMDVRRLRPVPTPEAPRPASAPLSSPLAVPLRL